MWEWEGLDIAATFGLLVPLVPIETGGTSRDWLVPFVPFPPPPELRDTSKDGKDELEDELDIWDGDVRRSNELWGELGNESRSQ